MSQGIRDIATLAISALALILSLIFGICASRRAGRSADASERSAAASEKSAEIAQNALGETERQRKLAVTPSITASVQPSQNGRHECLVIVNAGPGIARNISCTLHVSVSVVMDFKPDKVIRTIDQLLPAASKEVYSYAARFFFLRGSITYEDIEGGKHCSRYDSSKSKDWEFETDYCPKTHDD